MLAADLGDPAQCARVEERAAATERPVDLLVNNAGFGTKGDFHAVPREREEQLLAVNVRAVMRLTHAALGQMVPRGHGSVLNVSSVAGFSPGARGATYSASKAWVTNFSESLNAQLASRGVTVSAVAPGFTRTEFHSRAQMDMSGIPERMWLSAEEVVDHALDGVRRGRALSVPGRQYQAIVALTRVAPRRLVTAGTRVVRSRSR